MTDLKKDLVQLETLVRRASWVEWLRLALIPCILLLGRQASIAMSIHDGHADTAQRVANIPFVFLTIVFIVIHFVIHRNPKWKYLRANNIKLEEMMSSLYLKLEKNSLDIVCKIAKNGNYFVSGKTKRLWEEKIAELLLSTGADEVALSPKSLAWLRKRVKQGDNPALRIAGLLTLSERGDAKIESLAREAAQSDNERVQAAARDVLAMRGQR